MDWIIALDRSIIFSVQDMVVTPWLTPLMRFISFIGEYAGIWVLLGVLFCLKKEYRRVGVTVLLGVLFTLLVGNITLKHLVMRLRPCIDYAGVSVASVIPAANDYSFPSGHTFSSFAATTALILFRKNLWTLLALCVAVVMGFSRIYLFMHYPSDVIIGAILGVIFGIVSWKIVGKRM
ncbi:phosphatase PAP2 family protein [Anaerovibrio lipolyticus]|uniref:phosphatase PAP2 family protein n=1 Tax=Anaerovibrio lipolyticus TaxID=82374 RepID=UPI0026EC8F9D|nr:phosphatase PAP2 family protein [Anaerovibrio lipolyticus]MBE6104776.1 phosphatase PAP2 family protein [Anaerovibrio lipolyticus]